VAEARIKLSIAEGTFEIEGPESFVSKQIEAFGDVIKKALSDPAKKPKTKDKAEETDPPGGGGDYSDVFELHEGAVKVLADIPGDNNKSKTVNAGLIAAFARSTEGADTVSFDDVREICKQHSCLDATNFSKYLKGEKKAFVFGGTPKKQTIKLTVPGKKQAKALVEGLSG
jgi:hypothetical protein